MPLCLSVCVRASANLRSNDLFVDYSKAAYVPSSLLTKGFRCKHIRLSQKEEKKREEDTMTILQVALMFMNERRIRWNEDLIIIPHCLSLALCWW